MKKIILVPALILILSACSTPILRTTTPPADISRPDASTSARIGVPYYLPRALIPITITLDKPDPDPAKSATPSKPTDPAKPADSAKPADPIPQKIGQFMLTIGTPLLIPDTSKRFFLEYHPERATEDDVSIGVGTNQLLQTTTATSIDKSGEALVTIARIGIETFKFIAPGLVRREHVIKPEDCPKLEPTKIVTYLDPWSKANEIGPFSIDSLNNLLKANYVPMLFSINPFYAAISMRSKALSKELKELKETKVNLEKNFKDAEQKNDQKTLTELDTKIKETQLLIEIMEAQVSKQEKNESSARLELEDELKQKEQLEKELSQKLKNIDTSPTGVLFRTSEPYVLELSVRQNINTKEEKPWCIAPETRQMLVMAPNKGGVYSVDVNRGALITKKTDLTIIDGMLTKIDVNKPSSLTGLLSIPLDIIKAIINTPAELLTLRIKQIEQEGALTKAQADKLMNELTKFNNQKLLKDAQNPSSASQ